MVRSDGAALYSEIFSHNILIHILGLINAHMEELLAFVVLTLINHLHVLAVEENESLFLWGVTKLAVF